MKDWENEDVGDKPKQKVSVGDIVKIKLEGVGSRGDMFGSYQRLIVFVKGAAKIMPGEVVQVKIIQVKENCAFSELC
jgi:predicted RNA-binding protein with TRAM domain